MSVSNTAERLSVEAGNDVQTDFGFQFKIFAKTDIKCWKVSAASPAVYTLGVLDVDFTLSFDTDAETGTVSWVVPPVTGGYSVIAGSEIPLTQGTIFSREGVTPSRTTKIVADKLTLLLQQISDALFGRAILKSETLDILGREDISVSETPITRRAMVYERNSGDDGWNIVPSDSDPDTQAAAAAVSAAAALASQNAAAVSAAAALASQNAAAASAAGIATSGAYADRPVTPAAGLFYYSTDRDSLELWIPDAGRWFLIG